MRANRGDNPSSSAFSRIDRAACRPSHGERRSALASGLAQLARECYSEQTNTVRMPHALADHAEEMGVMSEKPLGKRPCLSYPANPTREIVFTMMLGGEKVSYLPQKDGKIVCGCFSTDANPEAPYVILVGGDDDGEEHPVEKKAKILEDKDEPIPVFLKRASNDWVYEGNFRVQRVTRDRQFLEEKQRAGGARRCRHGTDPGAG